MDQIAVHTEGLKKNFGKVQALNGIDLRINTGQIYGFLGPNGAGKTTLIRSLIGATKISGGKVFVMGLDPDKNKKNLRKFIGYMPQAPALYDDMSAKNNIKFFGGAHGKKDLNKKIEKVIDFVDLRERIKDPVYTFSGGMKQRISLACALVNEPKVLFLDEPTSGVDPQLRDSFWKHFRELASRGVTIFVSTHQMDEAMYCDNLAVLHKGILLADDTPKNLLWKKEARIKIWNNERNIVKVIENYPENLPVLLKKIGLDKRITRIEIDETSLETVILNLIKEKVEGGDKMSNVLKKTGSVAKRVFLQLRGDKRFLAGSILIPLVIIYFMNVVLEAMSSPGFDPSIYVIPYGGFIVHFITFILTAIVLVRERTSGTLSRMFISGYYQIEIISGYVLSYSLLATVQSLTVLIELNWLFELEFSFEKLASIYLVMWLLSILSVALGTLISNFARNEGQVFPFIPLVILSAILSGIILPVERLPEWSQVLSYLTPLFYSNEILQELIANRNLADNLGMVANLLIYGLVVMSLAVMTLREKD